MVMVLGTEGDTAYVAPTPASVGIDVVNQVRNSIGNILNNWAPGDLGTSLNKAIDTVNNWATGYQPTAVNTFLTNTSNGVAGKIISGAVVPGKSAQTIGSTLRDTNIPVVKQVGQAILGVGNAEHFATQVLFDTAFDKTIGTVGQAAKQLVTGQAPALVDVFPGYTPIAKSFPGVVGRLAKQDKTTLGQTLAAGQQILNEAGLLAALTAGTIAGGSAIGPAGLKAAGIAALTFITGSGATHIAKQSVKATRAQTQYYEDADAWNRSHYVSQGGLIPDPPTVTSNSGQTTTTQTGGTKTTDTPDPNQGKSSTGGGTVINNYYNTDTGGVKTPEVPEGDSDTKGLIDTIKDEYVQLTGDTSGGMSTSEMWRTIQMGAATKSVTDITRILANMNPAQQQVVLTSTSSGKSDTSGQFGGGSGRPNMRENGKEKFSKTKVKPGHDSSSLRKKRKLANHAIQTG
jgi:hypothetical protein